MMPTTVFESVRPMIIDDKICINKAMPSSTILTLINIDTIHIRKKISLNGQIGTECTIDTSEKDEHRKVASETTPPRDIANKIKQKHK
jgi:hypothetical protein